MAMRHPLQSTDAAVLEAFMRGETERVCALADGEIRTNGAPPAALIPGSFNPLHVGHCLLAGVAEEIVGGRSAFELSVANVDKPALLVEEVQWRLAQFRGRTPVWLTRAPTFLEKSALFPGVVFVVGADTAARIVSPRYHGDSDMNMRTALDAMRRRSCRFLVAGRVDEQGRFIGAEDLAIPEPYRDLFAGIPEKVFRLDLSSTRLRQQSRAGS